MRKELDLVSILEEYHKAKDELMISETLGNTDNVDKNRLLMDLVETILYVHWPHTDIRFIKVKMIVKNGVIRKNYIKKDSDKSHIWRSKVLGIIHLKDSSFEVTLERDEQIYDDKFRPS